MPTTIRIEDDGGAMPLAGVAAAGKDSLAAADLTSSDDSSADEGDTNVVAKGSESFPTTAGLTHRRKNSTQSSNKNVGGGSKTTSKTTSKTLPPMTTTATVRWWIEFVLGSSIFVGALPFVVLQIICCTVWEFVDQSTLGVVDLISKLNAKAGPYVEWLVSNPKDSFVVNTTIWLGAVLPAYFAWEAYCQTSTTVESGGGEFNWYRAALYNLVRIGPMYRNFMYVYVLCHKEAHCFGKIFKQPYSKVLGGVYNHWVGFFHGVLPGPFTQSHIYNHHKYDNARQDVYSTGAFPRDNFWNFLHYIWTWFLYALNVSTVLQFYRENKLQRVVNTVGGTTLWAGMVTTVWWVCGPTFTIVYVLYPVVEGNILLAMVNYTWHAFIDPSDPENDYVNSVTILEGLNFCLKEEYHVVHHQYAGIHWSRHEEKYEEHLDEYIGCTATVFEKCNIFVIWGMIVAKDYEGLTQHYVQLNPDKSKHLTKQQLAQLLKERLQSTTWTYGS
mmetsp:Transcript_34814/g.84153  ORF Transcript_34814/g.84153 Transcript_34814/m.84153 type:complete len:498 (-) Transcript_34814:323-1816(-)|eukprot:CAMPEP_0113459294 /NCGR_PEP_ID=MMETSP0014_2-20120614/10372_1 /TAXON_ID=2857 /ORGANISM="Nitzschia sp." /LENGTH=497 /DNA_ID=CAMNT_0000350861 /DNA_START=158 /DNA_END=1651 /DNA_ORIENTATION=- /assembly_acc=CAM_ASM_000159